MSFAADRAGLPRLLTFGIGGISRRSRHAVSALIASMTWRMAFRLSTASRWARGTNSNHRQEPIAKGCSLRSKRLNGCPQLGSGGQLSLRNEAGTCGVVETQVPLRCRWRKPYADRSVCFWP